MSTKDGRQLADLSQSVRESTLKRLRRVSLDFANWRPTLDAMSFADIAQHLAECDLWLFDILGGKHLPAICGKPKAVEVRNRENFERLIEDLRETGKRRFDLLNEMDEAELKRVHDDPRFDRPVTVWWTIVRGCLDHETHHRGQITVYLRLAGIVSGQAPS